MNKYLNDNVILGDSLEFFGGMNYPSQGGGGNLARGSQGGYLGVAWG